MAIDFTKWRVDQIRMELIKLTGMSLEEAEQVKGKSQLVEKLIEARRSLGLDVEGVDFDNIEMESNNLISNIEENDEDSSGEEAVDVPQLGSPFWQEYILSLLNPEECEKKGERLFPKAAGLRRVAQIVLGPIIESGPVSVWPASGSNNRATVVYQLKIMWTNGMKISRWMPENELLKLEIPTRTFSEVADASEDNTPSPFNLHPSATASSRAEGRALRKALQLNIVTAEEMSLSLPDEVRSTESINYENEPITSGQLALLKNVASRLGINLEKTLQFHNLPSDVATLTREQASLASSLINKYQGSSGDSLPIPDIIKE